MSKKKNNSNQPVYIEVPDPAKSTDGYPAYPDKEDIYLRSKKEESIDPDNIYAKPADRDILKGNSENSKEFIEDLTGEDLDIPGAELDDDMENIGSEDEENNYYSLGGDNHNNLDED
jgi:hypothetical protein